MSTTEQVFPMAIASWTERNDKCHIVNPQLLAFAKVWREKKIQKVDK